MIEYKHWKKSMFMIDCVNYEVRHGGKDFSSSLCVEKRKLTIM